MSIDESNDHEHVRPASPVQLRPAEAKQAIPSALAQHHLPAPSIDVPNTFAMKHPNQLKELSKHQLIYSVAGLILGLVCILGGIALFLNGVAGNTSWTAKMLGAESTVSDAAPGAVLFIVGLFVVFVTRYVLKVKH